MHVRKSRSEWSAIVSGFERSGMSHEEFCSVRGLNIGSFRGWLYRIRREASASAPTVALLPIEVTPTALPWPKADVVIAVSELEVRVPIGADVGYVAGLIAELRARC